MSDHGSQVRRVLWLTLGLNLAVALAKIGYGMLVNSLSIRADGFHSLTDSTNNLIGIASIFLASRPPDDKHPYGHQKFEILAAGAIGASLILVAWDVGVGAWRRAFGTAEPMLLDDNAFVVLFGTLLVNVGVSWYEKKRGEQLRSTLLISDAAHTRSDIFVTLGIVLAVFGVRLGYPSLDLIGAAVVAVFIAYTGVGLLRENARYLLDTALISEDTIKDKVLKIAGVASSHKIRTRGTPNAIHVDLHIQIAPHLNVVQAHQVTHWVIDAVREIPGVIDVVVHTEPAMPDQPYTPLPWDTAPKP
ncbi:MAG TPA: cation diffusion facilitator family transporter [Polyangiaceae bacterium]|nr:cation diffusion facilitator family transporter [Polyangiaceae bacterium]